MALTVKINGTFEVVDSAGTSSPREVIKDNAQQITQVSDYDPWTVAGSVVNQQITFGGVTLAKRLFLRSDQPVTLKLNQSTDTGFSFGPGDGFLSSTNGITALYVSTGPNDTNLTVVVAGD
jgi:hypothetical protein